MVLEDALEPFRLLAQRYVAEGRVSEIAFSGPTYQMCCTTEKDKAWVFVQFDEHNQVKDLFCSCATCSQTGACVHMATALCAIYNQSTIPLHMRFEGSVFCTLFAPLVQESRPKISWHSHDELRWGEEGLSFTGPARWLRQIELLASQKEETEETSIKFSALSEEEIAAWKEGILSARLRFELSAYADVAKLLFVESERVPCEFCFHEERGVPSSIVLRFEGATCSLPIKAPLEEVLKRLCFQKTTPPIKCYGGRKVRETSFDAESRTCTVSFEKTPSGGMEGKVICEGWRYIPGQAFIQAWLSGALHLTRDEDIIFFLEHSIPQKPLLPISYHLEVHDSSGLTITPFIDEPFDLQEASFVGQWVWNERLGFRKAEQLRFPPYIHVELEDLSNFLLEHKNRLALIPGGSVHERPPEESVKYEVDANGALLFHREVSAPRDDIVHDLGAWLYIEGQGFFPKESDAISVFDLPIPPHKVSFFINAHADWLQQVPGFFAPLSPIESIAFDIRYVKKHVEVTPVFQYVDPSYAKMVRLYDDRGFVPGVGFFSLPQEAIQYRFARTISPKDHEQWNLFFIEELPRLQQSHSCFVDQKLQKPKELRLVCHGLEVREGEAALPGHQLWEAGFYWESEHGKVASEELRAASRRGDRFFPSAAGLLDMTDERFGWLSSVNAPRPGRQYHLKAFDFFKIRAHDEFSFEKSIAPATSSVIDRLLHASPPSPPQLTLLQSTLRPYQTLGVEWLWFLYQSGLSGLLCDDMGVGKTYQAMGLLSAIIAAHEQKSPCRFLIICPTSLLWHWKEKLELVLPQLRVFVFFGGGRVLDRFTDDYQIFLTTYGIWRNEVNVLSHLHFEVAIFDELQIAKNHVSRIWAALSQVQANMRLGLTGTPVENQLRELKAVFDLVLPGYLPHDALFRSYYLRPIEKEAAGDRRELLSRYVRPFILRRRKQDVLPELPAKVEDIYTTHLEGAQKDLYRDVAARQGAPLIQQLHDDRSPIPYMHIFALLSALKQVCNHPATFLQDIDNYKAYESGKWNAFVELLEEAEESGQKVVVFSQFLSMLDIMTLHLNEKGIAYAQIRGSTKERGREIARFQNDPQCSVFLGSLQAAGLGIDLTAGSIVIHYDRWWNAARENQATDRVHRIGQSRGVLVYKLMTAKTIEERIDMMISKKAQLFEDVISYDDHQVVKKMNREELLELLEGLDVV